MRSREETPVFVEALPAQVFARDAIVVGVALAIAADVELVCGLGAARDLATLGLRAIEGESRVADCQTDDEQHGYA